jgi:hypothetical protein
MDFVLNIIRILWRQQAAGSSETVIHFYWNSWHHIPEESSLHMKTFIMYHSMICRNMCLLISNPLAQLLHLS